jgi:hypothetical protein
MTTLSLPQDIEAMIIAYYNDICNAEYMRAIEARNKMHPAFHLELWNTTLIYEELLRLQYEVISPKLVPPGYNKVQCAVHNRIFEDLGWAPMHIMYCDMPPNPPPWWIDLAARNRMKRAASS